MKILTVNLCIELGDVDRRLQALEQLVYVKKPDFIALQGVANNTLSSITTSAWGTRYPHVAQPPVKYETRTKPTVAILSTFPVLKSKTVYYEESKSLAIIAYYALQEKSMSKQIISISSTRLDCGPENSRRRQNDINQLMREMSEDRDCFIVGDLGLLRCVDGELELSEGWQDSWITSGNAGGGFTMDSGKNSLIRTAIKGRPDRILFRSLRYRLESTEVVGVEKYRGVHISSHFGVFSSFVHRDIALPTRPTPAITCSACAQ